MIQTRPTRAFAIPVVAANRHHLHQNTRHEHDYPCWQTTAALNTRRLSMPCLSTCHRPDTTSPDFSSDDGHAFSFPLFSTIPREKETSTKEPSSSEISAIFQPYLPPTPRPRFVRFLRGNGYQLLSSRTTRAELLGPRQTSICSRLPFEASARERERERLGPVKSLEELAIRSNYGTRPSVSTTLFSPFRFTNLEHQLIPGKTKLSARIPEEHPTTFLLCPPRSRGRLDVRSKLIRPWKERERHQGARSREHNSTRKRTEGDLISMLILPSHRGPSVFTAVSVARSPPPPRRGIADYGLEPVGPHRAWRPRRGGKEANKYRAIGCSFF